jgi:outer membrane protein assembly factor BamA
MFKTLKHTYIFCITLLFLGSCYQAKFVPEGKYLLKKNDVTITGDKLEDPYSIIRQNPNFKTLGVKLKLWAYNRIDSAKVADKRLDKNLTLRTKNNKIRAREKKVNDRKIAKAKKKGQNLYTKRTLTLKDTLDPPKFFREWFKYKFGEKPIVFDSIPYNKTLEQLTIYLKNKGYYYGSVKGEVLYNNPKKKATVNYQIVTGNQYHIGRVKLGPIDRKIEAKYLYYLKVKKDSLQGKPFDKDLLDAYRAKLAAFMRNEKIYGFSPSNISYVIDTNKGNWLVDVEIVISNREKVIPAKNDDEKSKIVTVPHLETFINKVYFHLADTLYCNDFSKRAALLKKDVLEGQFVNCFDTIHYQHFKNKRKGEIDPIRSATFLYNCKMSTTPEVIELQNYLEGNNWYKGYYIERSYSRLMQLGVFESVKPVIDELYSKKDVNYIDVHYYLVPSKRQTFSFEPRATNSNGFLGVAASVNYTNKSLFYGAEKLILSLSGGFESQPPIFDETLSGEKIQRAGRSFNTFEFGPSIKYDAPGLFPVKVSALSKRQRPRTVISTALNYQRRADFERTIFQMNYMWRLYIPKDQQVMQLGLPFASVIKYVDIRNSSDFQSKLDVLNDLFLKNAYSNQFIWQDWRVSYEYENKDKEQTKKDFHAYVLSNLDLAGNMLSFFKDRQDTIANGQHTILGIGYSQFVRIDNEVNLSYDLPRKSSLNSRFQLGGGIPYGNTKTSLPYDYSFFAGGANDNRGWRARALGPGSYQYYLDTNRTATQIGDIRLATSVEYRFSLGGMLRSAVFLDAGNVWTFNEDTNRVGSQFTSNWYKEIALSAGIGVRLDLDFFIVRFDIGLPLTNPALPEGERWIFDKTRPVFVQQATAKFGANYGDIVPKLFTPVVHFGIGYPF